MASDSPSIHDSPSQSREQPPGGSGILLISSSAGSRAQSGVPSGSSDDASISRRSRHSARFSFASSPPGWRSERSHCQKASNTPRPFFDLSATSVAASATALALGSISRSFSCRCSNVPHCVCAVWIVFTTSL